MNDLYSGMGSLGQATAPELGTTNTTSLRETITQTDFSSQTSTTDVESIDLSAETENSSSDTTASLTSTTEIDDYISFYQTKKNEIEQEQKRLEDLQRAIDVFESGKSGFGLNRTNTTETFEGRDNTALEGIYDSSVIDTAIENYMKELSDSNASRAQWQELYDVLQQEQQKYTTNDIMNSVIPKTASSIDLNQYLEDIKKEMDKQPTVEFNKLEVLGDD